MKGLFFWPCVTRTKSNFDDASLFKFDGITTLSFLELDQTKSPDDVTNTSEIKTLTWIEFSHFCTIESNRLMRNVLHITSKVYWAPRASIYFTHISKSYHWLQKVSLDNKCRFNYWEDTIWVYRLEAFFWDILMLRAEIGSVSTP